MGGCNTVGMNGYDVVAGWNRAYLELVGGTVDGHCKGSLGGAKLEHFGTSALTEDLWCILMPYIFAPGTLV